MIKPKEMRRVSISFSPRQGGLYGAVLKLAFHDHKRKADFVVERALTGWAERPPGGQGHNPDEPAINAASLSMSDEDSDHGGLSVDEEVEYLESDGTGISVSHEDGVDFGIVERKRPNGPFATPSHLLTIQLSAGFPNVMFVKEKTRTLDGSDSEYVASLPQFCLIHRCTRFEAVFEGDFVNIRPGTEGTVRVIFSPKFEGVFKTTLELVFYHSLLSTWFAVRRTLRGVAGSLNDYKHIESASQGDGDEPTVSCQEAPPLKIILLFPPDWRRNSTHLPDYEVPTIIQEAVDNSTTTCTYNDKAPNLISILRPDSLATTGTYVHYFEALLCVEDGHQKYVLDFFLLGLRSNIQVGGTFCASPLILSMFMSATSGTSAYICLDAVYRLVHGACAVLRLRMTTKISCQRWPLGISFGSMPSRIISATKRALMISPCSCDIILLC